MGIHVHQPLLRWFPIKIHGHISRGRFPIPILFSHRSVSKTRTFSWVSGGFVERRIPGQNGGRYPWRYGSKFVTGNCTEVFLWGS